MVGVFRIGPGRCWRLLAATQDDQNGGSDGESEENETSARKADRCKYFNLEGCGKAFLGRKTEKLKH
jgi:hypothetical protein